MTRNNNTGHPCLVIKMRRIEIPFVVPWRVSLVPAAAVIPAPIAYIKVVAVKKLVVGFLPRATGPPSG